MGTDIEGRDVDGGHAGGSPGAPTGGLGGVWGAKSRTDPDGDWTRSGCERRSHLGYKVHRGVEAGTGLVRRAVLTLAKVYESEGGPRPGER